MTSYLLLDPVFLIKFHFNQYLSAIFPNFQKAALMLFISAGMGELFNGFGGEMELYGG